MRRTCSESSEMVNQLLFGDLVNIMEEQPKWFYIQTLDCGYYGWVDRKMIEMIDCQFVDTLLSLSHYFVKTEILEIMDMVHEIKFPILKGSVFSYLDGVIFIGNYKFKVIDEKSLLKIQPQSDVLERRQLLLNLAKSYLNTPYLWGGRSPFGIDCSGFVQVLYRAVGYAMDRDAGAQSKQGQLIDCTDEILCGDLAFFENEEGRIIHVGMLLSSDTIIHASGQVRQDKFDHYGIYNTEKQTYTHRLKIMKRYI